MAKLVKCKTCGADMAKTAKYCPHCGAKNNRYVSVRSVLTSVLLIWAALLIFIFVGDSGLKSNSASRQQEDTEEEIIEISATDLWAMYDENEVNADNLYKNKTLWVTGIVSEIGKSGNTPYVLLKAGDTLGIFSIQCNFNGTTEQDKLALIRDGNYIRIGGICTGKSINVILKNCTIEW